MAIFNSYVKLPEGNPNEKPKLHPQTFSQALITVL